MRPRVEPKMNARSCLSPLRTLQGSTLSSCDRAVYRQPGQPAKAPLLGPTCPEPSRFWRPVVTAGWSGAALAALGSKWAQAHSLHIPESHRE